jgi:hypothetical protein
MKASHTWTYQINLLLARKLLRQEIPTPKLLNYFIFISKLNILVIFFEKGKCHALDLDW